MLMMMMKQLLSMLMLLLVTSLSCEQEVRELLDPDRGGIGGSARSGEAEERLETLAQRREELSKVTHSSFHLSIFSVGAAFKEWNAAG